MDNNCYRLGLDVGSTTAKIVILDPRGEVAFCDYRRHQADIDGVVSGLLHDAAARLGDPEVAVTVTGSVGMGIAERFAVPFVQEVIAAVQYVRQREHGIATIIDIGGEDAKIVYLRDDGQADLRMNGNCAGGTGAFIDQMALLLGTEIDGSIRWPDRRPIYTPSLRGAASSPKPTYRTLSARTSRKPTSPHPSSTP